ncbi:MAG: OmpH family outer membrane protein [Thermodesulfobacteriota bacterium]|nr:OmpH family outer membrane protein [Thermodesulfobacteriota bacterium]
MMIKSTLVAVTLVALFTMESFGAEMNKIGLVDFQKILRTSHAGKAAQAEINAEGKKMESELKRKGEEIQGLEKTLEREQMVLSNEAREERQRDVRIKINDFKNIQAKYRVDLKKLEARVIKRIEDGVFGLVEQIAKDKDYSLVLEKRAGGVIYFKEAMDMTDSVIEKYDKQAPAKQKKTKE